MPQPWLKLMEEYHVKWDFCPVRWPENVKKNPICLLVVIIHEKTVPSYTCLLSNLVILNSREQNLWKKLFLSCNW